MRITAAAPAKINLSLYVVSKRSDGYHNIHSVMQALDFFELVHAEKLPNSSGIQVKLSGSAKSCGSAEIFAEIPTNSSNTAFRAASEFFKFTKIKPSGVLLEIQKSIPVGAGLAGGSADAAAAICALNSLFEADLTLPQMLEIGAEIGADVPFCLLGGAAVCTGIGADMVPLTPLKDCHILLIKPDIFISTAAAYQKIDENLSALPPASSEIERRLNRGSLAGVSAYLENHFELCLPPDSADKVEKIRRIMLSRGALGARMTGSGSCVFGIFENESAALLAKSEAEKLDFCSWCRIARPHSGGADILENNPIL